VEAATEIGTLEATLRATLADLADTIEEAEGLHDTPAKAAAYLTDEGAAAMLKVREACDALEVRLDDSKWPLPRYREILFPV
jgi:glutamine synthetase